jgi:hypothetical protein
VPPYFSIFFYQVASSLGIAACLPIGRSDPSPPLQPFFSASAVGRLGRFSRWALDHTELGARVDLGVKRECVVCRHLLIFVLGCKNMS